MTKKEVGQLYYINKEIRVWQRELQKICNSSSIKGQQLTGMPFSGGISDSTADRGMKVAGIENKLYELSRKAAEQEIKILNFIETIEDSQNRQIVYMRAVRNMSWRRIAHEIGGYNTEDSVRMKYNRLFK